MGVSTTRVALTPDAFTEIASGPGTHVVTISSGGDVHGATTLPAATAHGVFVGIEAVTFTLTEAGDKLYAKARGPRSAADVVSVVAASPG